jgi:large subunit ribosomal protein L14
MIQGGTTLNVLDNSGAKKVVCIKQYKGYKRHYSFIGQVIKVAIKRLRFRRRKFSKVKKGELVKALIVRTKVATSFFTGNSAFFFMNSVILITKQNKLVGTRVFGILSKTIRTTKFLKLIAISAGVL